MKLKNYIVLALLATFLTTYAQVGIGTVTPEGVLDLNNDSGTNSYGMVLPRVALSRTDEAAPVVDPDPSATAGTLPIGTVVYNTATTSFGSNSVYPGIYMWDGVDWINEFPKRNAQIFKQDNSLGALRTFTTGSYQNIPGLVGQTFTPRYSGTYKIEVSMNWGSGNVVDTGSSVNVAAQKGIFKFTFNGVDKLTPMQTWSSKFGGGTVYYDIWEQTTIVLYKDLVAGTAYPFSLGFDQTVSAGFIDNGNTGAGMGWLGGDIPCTVEFVFID